jgi:hypothetical protein
MSYAKMNTFIDIISPTPAKDTEGFAAQSDTVLASVRAFFERGFPLASLTSFARERG